MLNYVVHVLPKGDCWGWTRGAPLLNAEPTLCYASYHCDSLKSDLLLRTRWLGIAAGIETRLFTGAQGS